MPCRTATVSVLVGAVVTTRSLPLVGLESVVSLVDLV